MTTRAPGLRVETPKPSLGIALAVSAEPRDRPVSSRQDVDRAVDPDDLLGSRAGPHSDRHRRRSIGDERAERRGVAHADLATVAVEQGEPAAAMTGIGPLPDGRQRGEQGSGAHVEGLDVSVVVQVLDDERRSMLRHRAEVAGLRREAQLEAVGELGEVAHLASPRPWKPDAFDLQVDLRAGVALSPDGSHDDHDR